MCSILENLLLGVVSGFVSSVIVTQAYRQLDKKRDRFEYINELTQYVYDFKECLFWAGGVEIEDEYIMHLADFVMKNTLPRKKKWAKLTKNEIKICNSFIAFYQETMSEIWECKLNIQCVQKGEIQYVAKVNETKINISNIRYIEATNFWGQLLDLRKKYVN